MIKKVIVVAFSLALFIGYIAYQQFTSSKDSRPTPEFPVTPTSPTQFNTSKSISMEFFQPSPWRLTDRANIWQETADLIDSPSATKIDFNPPEVPTTVARAQDSSIPQAPATYFSTSKSISGLIKPSASAPPHFGDPFQKNQALIKPQQVDFEAPIMLGTKSAPLEWSKESKDKDDKKLPEGVSISVEF
ncbi:MAG: hypothetical protein AAF226_02505 [Verrucomicrobiota bacterium]